MNENNKIAGIYVRVSTEEQSRHYENRWFWAGNQTNRI